MRRRMDWTHRLLGGLILAAAATWATGQPPTELPAVSTPSGSVMDPLESVLRSPDSLAHPAVAGRQPHDPQHRVGAAGDFIGFSHADGSGSQTITLVNTKKSWIAVYHISSSLELTLVSSRPIDADFSLQLNATDPLPEDIRRMEGQNRSHGGRPGRASP